MTENQSEAKKSCLYDKHIGLIDKSRLAPFAGYLMPLWYSSISDEHRAVRETAGLFDCTHMGVLQFQGPGAEAFLDAITTNQVRMLSVGKAHYAFFPDQTGGILDDIIIYKRSDDKFMVVVNAANEEKIITWLKALKTGRIIEQDHVLPEKPDILNLHDTAIGPEARVDIALQGPASLEILLELVDDDIARSRLSECKPFSFIETQINSQDVLISRTGYTGAKMGYELFVHPDHAGDLWDLLLERGAKPCGLGARDSLRIEAGLPLYGHELAGQWNISPFQAGYGWAVKLDKPFFIGRGALQKLSDDYEQVNARLSLPGKRGVRPVRENDAILNAQGSCIGWILSCTKIADRQIALAYIDKAHSSEGSEMGLYYVARNARHIEQGKMERVEKGQKAAPDLTGKIIQRFEKF